MHSFEFYLLLFSLLTLGDNTIIASSFNIPLNLEKQCVLIKSHDILCLVLFETLFIF